MQELTSERKYYALIIIIIIIMYVLAVLHKTGISLLSQRWAVKLKNICSLLLVKVAVCD